MRPRLPVVGVDATVSDGAVVGDFGQIRSLRGTLRPKSRFRGAGPSRLYGACSRSTARPGSTTVIDSSAASRGQERPGDMRIVKILSATVVTATVFGGVPAAQASVVINKKPAPSFDTTIKGRNKKGPALKQTSSTSASIAVVANGKTCGVRRSAGSTRRKQAIADDPVRVGSVSKVVTTMAVMQLVDQGGLAGRSGDALRAGFRDTSPQYKQITVRMLLNHSAGLPGTDYADAWSHEPIPSVRRSAFAAA